MSRLWCKEVGNDGHLIGAANPGSGLDSSPTLTALPLWGLSQESLSTVTFPGGHSQSSISSFLLECCIALGRNKLTPIFTTWLLPGKWDASPTHAPLRSSALPSLHSTFNGFVICAQRPAWKAKFGFHFQDLLEKRVTVDSNFCINKPACHSQCRKLKEN